MYAVDAPHRGEVAENDFVRPDADNGTVSFKEGLHRHALLEASDVCRQPKVRNSRIPRTGDRGEGREEEVVYGGGAEVEDEGGEREDEDGGQVVGEEGRGGEVRDEVGGG